MAIDLGDFLDVVLGLPYHPQKLHCWELVKRCQKAVFDRDLPTILVKPDDMRELIGMMDLRKTYQGWEEVDEPQHGAVVFMTKGGHEVERSACHAGVYLDVDGGGILHTDEDHGVVFESLPAIKTRNWGDFSFHVPVTSEET